MRQKVAVATGIVSLVVGVTAQNKPDSVEDIYVVRAGGVLTSNSIGSRQLIGETSDPRGYVQPSIATIRLWRRR